MEHVAAPVHGTSERRRIEEVADSDLYIDLFQCRGVAVGAYQATDLLAFLHQRSGQAPADEPGCPRDHANVVAGWVHELAARGRLGARRCVMRGTATQRGGGDVADHGPVPAR